MTTRLLFLSVCLSVSLSGFAQKSIVKYAPLSNIGFERVLQNNRSIYVGASLYSFGAADLGVTALGLKAEYRFYGLVKSSPKEAPQGLWVAPTALFWTIGVSDGGRNTGRAFITQLGGIAGYQWLLGEKFTIEPALGLGLTLVGSDSDSILGAGALPLAALRIGYVIN